MTSIRHHRAAAVTVFAVTFAVGSTAGTAAAAPAIPATAVNVIGTVRGDRGESVRIVQQAIIDAGVNLPGGVDGIFGPGTEQAVSQFQHTMRLPQTGRVDLPTAVALGVHDSTLIGLSVGSAGSDVVAVQQALIAAGRPPAGGADGTFGPATRSSLIGFQQDHGLAGTGTVDRHTAAILLSVDVGVPDIAPLVGLRVGSTGEPVKVVQRAIINSGFTLLGGADGNFGALTSAALMSFQNANGLPATGQVDDATARALLSVTDIHEPPDDDALPIVGLRYGSVGADVVALQQALISHDITIRGGADGIFGTVTLAAVKQFQTASGLEATGIIDQATADALTEQRSALDLLIGLKVGATGATVRTLQQTLIDIGVTVRGGADGIFGPATATAVKQFQTSQQLPATGVVDQGTVEALRNPTSDTPPPADVTVGYAVYGERGVRVLALQQALVNAGIPVDGGVDGIFGGKTSAAVMELQRRQGLPVTGVVNDATAAAIGLEPQPEPSPTSPGDVSIAVFPVQGLCWYSDTWGVPRSGGRTHQGVDIIAAEGKLLYAVASGTIEKLYYDYPGALAGNGLRLRQPDGTYFFYAHLSGFAPGIGVGSHVTAGQVIGYIGNTGNSSTPHLHFEIHPGGGAAVNPYPAVKAVDGCSITEPRPQVPVTPGDDDVAQGAPG